MGKMKNKKGWVFQVCVSEDLFSLAIRPFIQGLLKAGFHWTF